MRYSRVPLPSRHLKRRASYYVVYLSFVTNLRHPHHTNRPIATRFGSILDEQAPFHPPKSRLALAVPVTHNLPRPTTASHHHRFALDRADSKQLALSLSGPFQSHLTRESSPFLRPQPAANEASSNLTRGPGGRKKKATRNFPRGRIRI